MNINMMREREVASIQEWLDGFFPPDSGHPRRAWLGRTGEYIIVQSMPLPDIYQPDEIDALLLIDNFPSLPPIGLYVLNAGNERLVAQLSRKMNAFQNRAFHEAPSIDGYTWVCYAYANNRWRYNAAAPSKGDNVRKFLASFFAEVSE